MKMVKLKRYKNIIYEIYCTKTNKYYIGQTIKPLNDRMSKHFSDAKNGRKQPLYDDIRRYGRDYFVYQELCCVTTSEDLDDKERYWIDKYLKDGRDLYNLEFGGRKNVSVPYSTRVKMATSAGTAPFVVYDIHKNYIGRFEKIIDANTMLGTYFNNDKIANNGCSHGYIAFYELEFSTYKLDLILSNLVLINGKIRKKVDLSGKNNPMYNNGIHIFVYNENLDFVKEYYTQDKCVNETGVNKYSIKKYKDTFVPYKGYVFCSKRFDKTEYGYN